MDNLRQEVEEANGKIEEMKGRVKELEQENLAKEQEVTSLTHRNQLLEADVERLETTLREAKDKASETAQHSTQNESLQRRLQLMEEEAEETDKTLRETNEKCVNLSIVRLMFSIPAMLTSSQTSSNGRQGRPLRTQSTGIGIIARPMGNQVRGDVEEIRRLETRPHRARGLHQQCLIGRYGPCCIAFV